MLLYNFVLLSIFIILYVFFYIKFYFYALRSQLLELSRIISFREYEKMGRILFSNSLCNLRRRWNSTYVGPALIQTPKGLYLPKIDLNVGFLRQRSNNKHLVGAPSFHFRFNLFLFISPIEFKLTSEYITLPLPFVCSI